MEGGFRRKDEFPIGFRFKPKDVELVEHYLLPRLQGRRTVPNDSVVEANVYACHPETLAKEYKSGAQDEWYFLSPRTRMYGNGVRPARKTLDGRGRWKASTATKEVAEEVVCNGIRFCKNVLNYFEGNPKKEARTKWIMLELTIPEYEIKLDKPGPKKMLDEYVMCKIYVSPLHKKKGDTDDDDEEGASSACEEEEVACSSTQHSQVTAESQISEKQAGKRPMAEQPLLLGRAKAAPKQARHGSLSIGGSTQASCTTPGGNASRTAVYHGVPPNQAPRMQQRPAGAYNGQAPPAGACNGRGLVRMPTPTPVPYQPFTQHPFDEPYGLMPTPRPVQYQPFSQPIDEPFGLMPTMTRPPNSGNHAATPRQPCFSGNPQLTRPPVSAQCFYEHNYRAVQPLANASSSQLQRTQQPVVFNGDDTHRRGPAAASRGPSHNRYPYQTSSSSTPAASGHGGAVNERNVIVNAEEYFAELASFNPSLVVGRMQPEPARLVEAAAPAAAGGAARVKTGTGESSGLNTQDAA